MTNEECVKMLKAKLKCLKRETSGTDEECISHNCENCGLNYEQGNMGEQIEALDMAIKSLQQPNPYETVRPIRPDALYQIIDEKEGTVTLAPIKHKWKKISPAGIYECSRCGQNVMTDDIDCYKFCHGCGVDMRGDENDKR